jgi:hypothetical protein
VRSPGVQGLGLDVGAQRLAPSGGSGGVGANLLQWTEQFQNGVWVVGGILTVTPNAATGPLGGSTADLVAFLDPDSSTLLQTSVAAGTFTATTAQVSTTTLWDRYSVTKGAFCFSVWLRSVLGDPIALSLSTAGGLVRCGLFDSSGDNPSIFAWGAKLEAGATATGDATNYGMRTT